MSKILILTSELNWLKVPNLPYSVMYSPQEWDIIPSDPDFEFHHINSDEINIHDIDGILWREGHLSPDKDLEQLALQVKKLHIPCVNHPDVTLRCMDTVAVDTAMLNNFILSGYCKFQIHDPWDLELQPPFVLKLPDYHSGLGKWMIKTQEDFERLLKTKIEIKWKNQVMASGFVDKAPYISEKILIEPVLKGDDIRIWVYLDRESNNYQFKYLYRTAKEGQWLANRYTKNSQISDLSDPKLEEICHEAVKLLNYPDIIAVDVIRDKDDISILEINNDVPGMVSLEKIGDYSIHQVLLNNLQLLIENQ